MFRPRTKKKIMGFSSILGFSEESISESVLYVCLMTEGLTSHIPLSLSDII